MYSKKDFIARPIVEDIQIWDSKDGKYYISTAHVEGAMFYVYENITIEYLENGVIQTLTNWEPILEGYDLTHCIDLINSYES